jgi:glycosyltransferase involved in cell wall biosynthesis
VENEQVKRPHVIYWNNIPAPYNVERFNAVAARGHLNFEVWFNERTHAERSWDVAESDWQFRSRYLPAVTVAGQRLSLPSPLFGRELPDLLVSLYAEPSFLFGWVLARQRGVRTAFWSEVTFDRWVVRRRLKEALKRQIFPRVDGIITVGRDGRRFARRYGAPDARIHYAAHVVDVDHFAKGWAAALPERDRVRDQLGLRGVTFINVGRLWWGKGLDTLIDAFGTLQRRLEGEISLLLVGDGPEEAHLRQRCLAEGLRNVIFVGFKQKPDLPTYYTAADIFIFPTLGDPYGLVVDEAMACSLPVISSSAAGEIADRVEDGVNGFIVPPGNGAALLDRMERLAHESELRARMGEASRRKIEGHTPERWAEDFEYAVAQILCRRGQ